MAFWLASSEGGQPAGKAWFCLILMIFLTFSLAPPEELARKLLLGISFLISSLAPRGPLGTSQTFSIFDRISQDTAGAYGPPRNQPENDFL